MEQQNAKGKFPIGMILILILVGWGALSLILSSIKTPLAQIGMWVLSGTPAVIVNLIIAAILIAIFYGIIKKLRWARKLAIGWYIFSIVLALINLLAFIGNNTMYDAYYQEMLPPELYGMMTPAIITFSLISALFFGTVIGLIIIIYLARKKDFFVR